jgi:hypothetical protein
MKIALAAFLALLLQEANKDLKEACAKMEQVRSYHFTIKSLHEGEEKHSSEGEFVAPDLLHLRSEKSESVKKGDHRLVKEKDGDWKEPGPLARKLFDPTAPHEWVRKFVEQCPPLKREKSTKIGAVTVDIYVHSLGHESARKSFEGGGMPLIGSVADWSKTQNGMLFYIGRDDLIYKVEMRVDGKSKDDKKIDRQVIIEFSDFGKAKPQIPDAAREKLGLKDK